MEIQEIIKNMTLEEKSHLVMVRPSSEAMESTVSVCRVCSFWTVQPV